MDRMEKYLPSPQIFSPLLSLLILITSKFSTLLLSLSSFPLLSLLSLSLFLLSSPSHRGVGGVGACAKRAGGDGKRAAAGARIHRPPTSGTGGQWADPSSQPREWWQRQAVEAGIRLPTHGSAAPDFGGNDNVWIHHPHLGSDGGAWIRRPQPQERWATMTATGG